MLTKGNKSFVSKAGTSTLHEPESMRLGRDTESLVERMEHEKRESIYLDQQISLLIEDLNQSKLSKKSIFPAINGEDQQKNRCSVLEKRIELEIIHLNEIKSQNIALRNQVNNYRKEKKHFKRTLQNLREDISSLSKNTEETRQDYMQKISTQNKYKKYAQNLRSKSLLDKSTYSEKVTDFSMLIQEKIDIRKQIHKQIENGILGQIKKVSDSVEISKIQKQLASRWESKVKEKKKTLDNYMRHLNILKDTFDQIKMATGIHSVSEIVTSVIKSEEQNYEVYSYVNYLNSEIDKINEQYLKTEEEIKKLQQDPNFSSDIQEDIIKSLNDKKEAKKSNYENLFEKVQNLLPHLKNILKSCIASGLPITPPPENYLEMQTIEYDQISEFLGYIENYLKYANIFVSDIDGTPTKSRGKTPNALKDLEIKDFFNDPDFEDSKFPMSSSDFEQKTKTFLKTLSK